MNYKKFYSIMLLAAGMIVAASCSNAPKEAVAGQHDIQLKKITDYLYETTLDYDFDLNVGKSRQEQFRAELPACSSISLGKFRGRNLDWNYEDGSDVVIHTTKKDNRHASLGVASMPYLKNETAGDGQYHEEFEMLPFCTLDGINDAGICVNLNVVIFQEVGKWQMKTETQDDDLMEFLAPRMILDNCTYLTDIVPMMDEYDWFCVGSEYETHMMVTGPRSADDPTVTSVVFEYIPFTEGGKSFRKVCCISPEEKDVALVGGDASRFFHSKGDYLIRTNFNLWQFAAEKDRKGRLLSATEHPEGFERYEILEAACKTATTLLNGTDSLTSQHIQDIMFTVNYSNMYNLYQDNFWYTESPDLITKEELINATPSQRSPHGDLNNLIKGKDNRFIEGFKNTLRQWGKRDRKVKSELWETLHTSIYNYETRSLQIGVREGSVYYSFEM